MSVKCPILEEKSLLQDVVLLQHLVLKDFQPIDVKATSLENPQGAQKDVIEYMQVFLHRIDLGECHTSYSAIGNFRQKIHKDDVVVFKTAGGSHVGQVRFHVQVDEDIFTCVETWAKSESNTFIMQQDPMMIPLENIEKACASRIMDTDPGKAYVIP